MKITCRQGYRSFVAVLIAGAVFSGWVLTAGETGSERAGEADSGERDRRADSRSGHAEMLERLLDMSPERLARTRVLIERLERMEEEEREDLKRRIRDFHRKSPEEMRKLRQRWREMSPEEKEEHRRKLSERAERREVGDGDHEKVDEAAEERFREYFRQLPREERVRVLRELRGDARRGGG